MWRIRARTVAPQQKTMKLIPYHSGFLFADGQCESRILCRSYRTFDKEQWADRSPVNCWLQINNKVEVNRKPNDDSSKCQNEENNRVCLMQFPSRVTRNTLGLIQSTISLICIHDHVRPCNYIARIFRWISSRRIRRKKRSFREIYRPCD